MKRIARTLSLVALGGLALTAIPSGSHSQGHDPSAQIAAQRVAMRALAKMDGTWRGKTRIQGMDGKWMEHTQTERVGTTLDSTLKLIEGRGYDADGKLSFHAIATLGYDARKKAFAFRSHARGEVGDFAFTPTDSGFVWEIPTPGFTIRYSAVIRDGRWREVGDRIIAGRDPVRFIEMDLTRVGDTDWPAAGAVQPR